jgi:hypothetical protein
MADLAVTAAGAGRIAKEGFSFPGIMGEALAELAVVRLNTSGRYVGADGSASNTADVVGISCRPGGGIAGQPTTILRQGILEGLNLSGLNTGASVYLSDTTGALSDAAGTVSVKIGTVILGLASATNSIDKLLLVDIR